MRVSRLWGAVRRALFIVGAVVVVAVPSAGVARADDQVQLRSRLGDFCLDTPNGGYLSPVVINPCDGSSSQQWNVHGDGQIENVAFPGACLSLPGQSLWVHTEPCTVWFTQQWTIHSDGRVTTDFGGGCLTVLGDPGPGAFVSTRFCFADAPDQGWDSVT
jgi:hypothetical protein